MTFNSTDNTNFQPSNNSFNTNINLQTSLVPASLEAPRYTGTSSLAFIDANVSQIDTLIAGMAPGTEVHILKSGKDAITQITETLLNRQGISSLNIISHGSAGSLDFAANSLNAYNIRSYTDQLKSWGNALTENADILLYGCNVAENALGKAFVEIIRQVTGADVAASDNLTGNAELGGDWELEYKAGEIENPQVFQSSVQNAYSETLATYTVTNISDSGTGSLRDAINQANNNPGADNIVFGSIFSDATPDVIGLNSQLIINDSVTIQGTGQNLLAIRGMNSRVFFINQGIVNISGMTLTGRAQGGDGGPGAGGGLGAGGAIFINGVTSTGIVPTQVNISNVIFSNNQAIGGRGGYSSGNQSTGGGGGLNSNGGTDSAGGGGFGGVGGSRDSGGNGGAGGSGGFFGNTGGIGGTGTVTIGTTAGNGSNGGFGGGGGGGGFGGNAPEGSGGNGGDFGGGGGSGANSANIYVGNDRAAAGNGGFGGGGGASLGGKGGNGGFGAGAGKGGINGNAGIFGGNVVNNNGGAGAGLGGAIFVRSGSLNLTNATFSNNTATTSTGAPGTQAQGKGGAIFVNSDAMLTTSGITFSGNSATSAANTPFDNRDTYFLSEVSISSSNNAATESPYTESTFRISRKGSNNSQVVNFTVGGNATRSTDYTLTVNGSTITGNSVFIPTGQSFVDIVVRPIVDNVREGTENISINLLPGLDYLVTNANATVSIADQPTVNITTTDVNAVDSTGSTGAFRISRTDNLGELTVSFTSSGSASRGTDYNFTVAGAAVNSNNIVIPDGQNFIDVLVTPVNDTQPEGIENVILNLTSVSNTKYVVGSANATVNITDVPIVSITAEDADAVESVINTNTPNTGTFRISRTDTIGDLMVNFGRSGNATISNDYSLVVGGQPITGNSIIIPNGKSFVDVVVTPVRDGQSESMESVTLNLISDSNYFIDGEFATVNITDTPGIRITALDASAVESTRGTATFRVERTDSTGNAQIPVENRGSTSIGSDYTLSVNGNVINSSFINLNMLDGQSFVDIVVAPIYDTQQEGTETIILELGPQAGYQIIGNTSATVNITDLPVVSITAIDAWAVDSTANIGNTGTFRISRNDNIGNLWVDFARSDNFNTSLGTDYNLVVDGRNITGDSVLILDGQSFVDVVVVPRADNLTEGRETIRLDLLPDTIYSINNDNANATVNITDSPIVRVTAIDDSAVEATGSAGVFRIERTDSVGAITVNFSLAGAASSNEYNLSIGGKPLAGNSISMLNGQSFVDIVVTPIQDGQREATESVTLNLTTLSNANHIIGTASATVNVTDIPVVDITAIDADAVDSTLNGVNTGTFRVSRNDTVGDLKVSLGISGTATASDYILLVNGRPITSDNSVTIANGQSFVDVVLLPMRDGSIEGTENVTLDVLSSSVYSIGSANATVNITDSAVFRITALDGDAVESNRSIGTFRISRTDSTGNATVYFDCNGSASPISDYNLSAFGKPISGNSIEMRNGESYVDIFVSPISDSQQEATETVTLDLYTFNNNYLIDNASATINITDIPLVNITALDTDAVDTTGNTGAFRISRNNTIGDMVVNLERSGSATYGTDYTLIFDGREVSFSNSSVYIPAGESFVDVIVVPNLDGASEGKETVKLRLINNSMYSNSPYIIGNDTATVSIADFSIVRITAIDESAVEATRSTGTLRIFRTDSTGDTTVDFKLSGAASSNDYTLSTDAKPLSGNKIVMLNGQSFVDIVVTPISDPIREFIENVTLDLVSVSNTSTNHVIGVGSATVNITDFTLVDITAIDADAVDSTLNYVNTGTFRISRNDTVGNLKVSFARNGNATTNDYVLVVDGRVINTSDNSVIIANGKSFVDVTVEPARDSSTEGTENITLNLINPINYLIGNANATVNITDSPVVRIAALDGDAAETSFSSNIPSTGAFRISRTDNTGNITVNLDLSGSASFSSDYRLTANGKEITSGRVDMLNGQDYVDIFVTPISDTQQEGTETVTLGLMSTSNTTYAIDNNNSATVSITDRTTVSITAIDASAVDSTVNTGAFRISRNDTIGDLRVSFDWSGNASNGGDYNLFYSDRPQAVNREIIISDGQNFVDIVVVPVQDSLIEGSEAVTLSLSQTMSVYAIGNASATVNITDSSIVRIEALDTDAVEVTRSIGIFRISRTDSAGEVTANLVIRGAATLGSDYILTVDGKAVSNNVTMLNGQSFVDVVVTPTLDSQIENTETVTLDIINLSSLSLNSHTIDVASATVNITDIPIVNIAAIDASAVEPMRNTGILRISRNDTVGDLKVNLARSGNASFNTDYTLWANGKLISDTNGNSIIINNGESFIDVIVAPNADGLPEGTETVTLNLMPDTLYSIGNTNATVNITDIPVVNITTLDADAVESTLSTAIFRIERTDNIGSLTVNFSRSGNATFGIDYTLNINGQNINGSSITMLGGQSFVDVVVAPIRDGLQESTESVTLNLTSVSGGNTSYALGNTNATANITDLPTVNITAIDPEATELAGNTGTFRISRNDTGGQLRVNLTRGGNASIGSDYVLTSDGREIPGDSITFLNGQSFVDIVVTPNFDSTQEGNEVVTLTLIPSSGISFANSSAAVTIIDAPTVTISTIDVNATETPGNTGAFRISRTGTSGNLTVNFTRSGQATSGVDYTLSVGGTVITGNSVVISDGQQFVDVLLTPIDDTQTEAAETTQLQISTGNYAINTVSRTATVTIAPSDNPPTVNNVSKSGNEDSVISFSASDFTVQFTDIDGENLSKIKITSLPTQGILKLGGVNVTLNQEIAVTEIANLTFTPNANFDGAISFTWNGFDGSAYAAIDATVNITINPTSEWQIVAVDNFTSNSRQSILQRDEMGNHRLLHLNASNIGEAIALPIINSSWQIAGIADFTGDKIKDVFWRNSTTGSNQIWRMSTTGAEVINLPTVDYNNVTIQYIGDFEGDGDADILVRNQTNGMIAVWESNPANPNFIREVVLSYVADSNTQIKQVLDLDRDGDLDILWYNSVNGAVETWEMQGTSLKSGFALGFVSDTNTKIELVADFDGDKDMDILWYNGTTGLTALWEMNGVNIKQGAVLGYVTDTNTKIKHIGDFDGDKDLDILWHSEQTGFTAIWEMNGVNLKQGITIVNTSDTSNKIQRVGDFDFDGDLDILWHNAATGFTAIWEMNGVNLKQGITLGYSSVSGTKIQAIANFNGDTDPDVFWHNEATGFTAIWEMNGVNLAQGVTLPNMGIGFKVNVVGDLNGDGKLDIVWHNSTTSATKLWLTDGASIISDILL